MSIKKQKLDFWIKNNFNVLLIGKHGTGKTSTVLSAFKRNNLKYLYFSGSTMDPFVDFCGVPIKVKNADGSDSIELILPKHINPNEVEAIVIDEYNRSHRKIRNSVMELIQFKSINGKPFPKLRIVWAMINPEDSDDSDDNLSYDVEALDPAQKDRFQIHQEVPYECDITYFKEKYGNDAGEAVVEWWNALDKKTKNKISPRRLDYAIEVFNAGGELKDVLPKESNTSLLANGISKGSIIARLNGFHTSGDKDSARNLINSASYRDIIHKYILKGNLCEFCLPLMDSENFTAFISSGTTLEKVKNVLVNEMKINGRDSELYPHMRSVIAANKNKKLSKTLTHICNIANTSVNIPIAIGGSTHDDIVKDIKKSILRRQGNTGDRWSTLKQLMEIDSQNLSEDGINDKIISIDTILARSHQTTVKTMEKDLEVSKKLQIDFDILKNKYNRNVLSINKLTSPRGIQRNFDLPKLLTGVSDEVRII